jgi:hypothetical protein
MSATIFATVRFFSANLSRRIKNERSGSISPLLQYFATVLSFRPIPAARSGMNGLDQFALNVLSLCISVVLLVQEHCKKNYDLVTQAVMPLQYFKSEDDFLTQIEKSPKPLPPHTHRGLQPI